MTPPILKPSQYRKIAAQVRNATPNDIHEQYTAFGNMGKLFTSTDQEIILAGPAGTGKSRCNLEYLNYYAMNYPGCRLLMVRKTRRSLTESGMVTLANKVLHESQGVAFNTTKQQYQYPNGSIIAVGGLDKPSKIQSSEWDIIYAQEATELVEDDWEICNIRLRNGCLPIQRMIGDCNPASMSHWIMQRSQAGKLRMVQTRHEDNPTLFNKDGSMTPGGAVYISRLNSLTGVRYARYRLGLWVSAEGMVYEDCFSRAKNIVQRFRIPADWPRYMVIDFGFTHPFVCLWAAEDPDGRLYVYRQIYKTKTLVEDHAEIIKNISRWGKNSGDPFPRAVICDHDAEGRATLERHMGVCTTPAYKAVSEGIQAMASRLRPAGDGIPRLLIMEDTLIERDIYLSEGKQPAEVNDEFESYVWDTRQGMKKGEQPIKEFDHGMDALRYLCAYKDLANPEVSYYKTPWR